MVLVAVVPEASKKTESGETPEVRAGTSEGVMAAEEMKGVRRSARVRIVLCMGWCG